MPKRPGDMFIEYRADYARVGEVLNAVRLTNASKWVYRVRFKDGTIVESYNFDEHEVIHLA